MTAASVEVLTAGAKECEKHRRDTTQYAAMKSVGIKKATWAKYRDVVRAQLESKGDLQSFVKRRDGETDQAWLDRIADTIVDAMWAGATQVGVLDRWATPAEQVAKERGVLQARRVRLTKAARCLERTVKAHHDQGREEMTITNSFRKKLRRGLYHREVSAQASLQELVEELTLESVLLQEDISDFNTTAERRQEFGGVLRSFTKGNTNVS
mmetsp:Transcript_123543/g.184787  ORF Transcript_123543/g.184787 Transcript_123543/m.184787 type:complete len:211 (+) Transcript_123543:3-635(+)